MKKYINTNSLLKSIGVFLLFIYSAYFALIPVALFNLKNPNIVINTLLNLFSNLLLFLFLFLLYRKELNKEWKIFSQNKLECINSGFKYWFLGLIIMVLSNYLINYKLGMSGSENEKLVQKMIESMPAVMLLNAGLLAPFNEELTFRKAFRNVFTNKWIFISGNLWII